MSKFNKIYEYEYHLFGQVSKYSEMIKPVPMHLNMGPFMFRIFVSIPHQNVTVAMTSVSGHLLGLEFKAPFQKWYA